MLWLSALTLDSMFIPMASPVLAMNRTYNSLPACAICSLFNLANLKYQEFNIQSMEISLHPHSLTVIQFNSYRLVSSNNSFNEVKLSSIHIFNSLKEKKINSVHIITVNRNEIYIYIYIVCLILYNDLKGIGT